MRRQTHEIRHHALWIILAALTNMPLRAQEPLRILGQPPCPAPHDHAQSTSFELEGRPLPINLPTALQLANARAIDVATASERVRVAAAQLEQARVLWLPSVTIGGDYNRHDGKIQNSDGTVIDTSRGSWMF